MMKSLATFLLAIAPLLPVGVAHAVPACATANEAVSEEILLADVLTVYDSLPHSYLSEYLIQAQEQLDLFRDAAEKIRPIVARLQQHPIEDVKAACLLADAILYQAKWMPGVYLGEFGYECEAPEDSGLCVVADLFGKVLLYLQPDSAISPATRETLESFVAACGGVQAMNAVITWKDAARTEQVNAREYLAALGFFKDFCAAVSIASEEKCLLQLSALSKTLNQLSGGKKAELLRINYLVPSFRSALIKLWSDRCCPPGPYSNPVLPRVLRTEARLHALQPFFEQLPNLRSLVLDKATWQARVNSESIL